MSQKTTPSDTHLPSRQQDDLYCQGRLTPEPASATSSWQSHDEQRYYPYRSHRLEREYITAGFRMAGLVLAVILATFFASAASANSTRYEISRLASELCVAAEQLSFEFKRYNGLGNSARQASRLSREAGQLVDSLTRNRSDSTIRSRFSDVARQYRRLEEAYLRASRNIRHGVPSAGFSRVSDLFISLDYSLSYSRVNRVPQRRYYAPQPLSNFERLQRDSQRRYNYNQHSQRNRPGISNRGRSNGDAYRGGGNNRPQNGVGRDRGRDNNAGRGGRAERPNAAGRGNTDRPNTADRGNNRPSNRPNQAGRGDNQAGGRSSSNRRDAQRNPASRGDFDHRSPVLERQRNQDRSSRARSRAERGAGSRRRDN